MTITHDTTAQPSYDPETGAWDGQLPHADLVDQLPPQIKEHSLPDLDNTVKTLFYWAMDLDIPHGPRLALLTTTIKRLEEHGPLDNFGCWSMYGQPARIG